MSKSDAISIVLSLALAGCAFFALESMSTATKALGNVISSEQDRRFAQVDE